MRTRGSLVKCQFMMCFQPIGCEIQRSRTRCFTVNEKEKKKLYNERIILVEHSSLSLSFFSNGW